MHLGYEMLSEACNGRGGTHDLACPECGPGRRSPVNRKRRVLRVWLEPDHARWNCARCGMHGGARRHSVSSPLPAAPRLSKTTGDIDEVAKARRIKIAMRLWDEAMPLPDTSDEGYFAEQRGLEIDRLGDLSHALRWHAGERMIVALMRDTVTCDPCGVHRTFLNDDGSKRERRMLGRQGVIHLSPDDAVSTGLGICEGIEDGLAVLLDGWSPVWAATSAGAIKNFPVVPGIECLTIHADPDNVGMQAAWECAARWLQAGRETKVSPPPLGGVNA